MSMEKVNVKETIYKAFNKIAGKAPSQEEPSHAISDEELRSHLYTDLMDPGKGSNIPYILHPDLKKRLTGMKDPSSNVKTGHEEVTKSA